METLLKRLNDAGARYVVIGGQAMLQQGMPRFTLDWDIFFLLKLRIQITGMTFKFCELWWCK